MACRATMKPRLPSSLDILLGGLGHVEVNIAICSDTWKGHQKAGKAGIISSTIGNLLETSFYLPFGTSFKAMSVSGGSQMSQTALVKRLLTNLYRYSRESQ